MTDQHSLDGPEINPPRSEPQTTSGARADYVRDRTDRAAKYVKDGAERATRFVKDRATWAGDAVKTRSGQIADYIRREFRRPIPSLLAVIAVLSLLIAGYMAWSGNNEREALRAQLESQQLASASVAEDQPPFAMLQQTIAQISTRARQAQDSLDALQAGIADADKRMNAQRAEVVDLTHQLRQAQESEAAAREELAGLRSEAEALREKVGALAQTNEQLKTSLGETEAEISELRQAGTGAKLTAIEAQLKSVHGDLAQAQHALAKAQRALANRPEEPASRNGSETTGQGATSTPAESLAGAKE